MKWEWSDEGDDNVAEMWGLMKRLSDSGAVVYSKWYQGRATFFSKKLFTAILCQSMSYFSQGAALSRPARTILETLESDSPLSTKQLKRICELQGKDNARVYERAMRELFRKFLIVAYGEVDDGAFPSLAVGSTRTLFEDLYIEAQRMSARDAQVTLDVHLPANSAFRKFYDKNV